MKWAGWFAIVALLALPVGAVPYTLTFPPMPSQIVGMTDPATGAPITRPLPLASIQRVNMYCKPNEAAPNWTTAQTFKPPFAPTLIDVSGPMFCAFTVVATAPAAEFVGERESDYSAGKLYALEATNPKTRPATFDAPAEVSAPRPIECLPAGKVCAVP